MARRDPHSYADDTQVETESFALAARVDFATKTLAAEVVLQFREPGAGRLDLDTRGLAIEHVENGRGHALAFELHAPDPVLGARLAIDLAQPTASVRIRYRTSPDASALQWLEPAQTRGGTRPYLFSQCQSIHARSIVPLQDTPRLRVKYTAELTIPRELRAVMAAAERGRTTDGDVATHKFEMPQPIPPYLFAFAVGDLKSRELSPRVRVWAEPAVVAAAAYEFADVEAMLAAAESLFGAYEWDRYDILVMPPSFPFGGMENPRLTFVTPTTIAGDRSLVSVIAHELSHSWTGNLVTNANAEHFWLNEGFTVYGERRITEALAGADMAALEAALGRRELDATLVRFADRPELTRLRTHLGGLDPDDTYSNVPYEKGYMLLCAIEQAVGRDAFTAWLRDYLATFRFRAITTDDFEAHVEAHLPGALAQVDARAWIDGPGIPDGAVWPPSARLDVIDALVAQDAVPGKEIAERWTATEWNIYLESLPRPASPSVLHALDQHYQLTASTNYDVLVAWLVLALQSGYLAVLPRVWGVLAEVGRMKYLRPLYTALAADPRTRHEAKQRYERYRAQYHPMGRAVVEAVLRD